MPIVEIVNESQKVDEIIYEYLKDAQSVAISKDLTVSGNLVCLGTTSMTVGMDNVTDSTTRKALTTGTQTITGAKTFTSGLTGTTATLSGALSGTTATLSGGLTAATATLSGALTGTTATFSGLTAHNLGVSVGTTADSGQAITFYGTSGGTPQLINSNGAITLRASTTSKTVSLDSNGANKLTIGAGLGCVLTGSSVTIPNGNTATTGGIVIKGSSSDSSIYTTSATNNLNVNIPTSATYTLSQNGVAKYSISSDGLTATKGVRNLTFSDNTGDKVITFTNSGGNTTLTATNANGNLTLAVPTGASKTWTIGGTTLMSLKTPSLGTLGLTLTNCPINMSSGSGNGLQIAQPSSTLFQIVNPTASNDIYFASSHTTGNLIFQTNSITQLSISPTAITTSNSAPVYMNSSLTTYASIVMSGGLKIINAYKTGNYTVTGAEGVVIVNSTSSAITITIPASNTGNLSYASITIKRMGVNVVTITPGTSSTIDGSTSSFTLANNYDVVRLLSLADGTWAKI